MDQNQPKDDRPEQMTRPDTPHQQPPVGAEPMQPVHERGDVPPAPGRRGRPCGLFALLVLGVLVVLVVAAMPGASLVRRSLSR